METEMTLDFAGWLEFAEKYEARLQSIVGHGEHFQAVYELHCREYLGDRWSVQRDGDRYTLKKIFDHAAWLAEQKGRL